MDPEVECFNFRNTHSVYWYVYIQVNTVKF